jgi:hypothetical protein
MAVSCRSRTQPPDWKRLRGPQREFEGGESHLSAPGQLAAVANTPNTRTAPTFMATSLHSPCRHPWVAAESTSLGPRPCTNDLATVGRRHRRRLCYELGIYPRHETGQVPAHGRSPPWNLQTTARGSPTPPGQTRPQPMERGFDTFATVRCETGASGRGRTAPQMVSMVDRRLAAQRDLDEDDRQGARLSPPA